MNNTETYAFCAMLSRMKYITRWGLMRSSRQENLSEHTAEAAILAHCLAHIATDILHLEDIRPDTIAVAAIYHDASEILTGDMPTPVKYKNKALKTAYKQLERESAEHLSHLLPPQLQENLYAYLSGDILNEAEKKLLKAADRLSALVKCLEEESSGNTEFRSAKAQQISQLKELNCPAADYFITHFLPCYEQNLDELSAL